jgi:probable phosphoglycerate mutase
VSAQPPARFVLIRHGEAEGNRDMRYLGTTDAPLTERGRAQAVQLAHAALLFRVTAIYSSPLERARATAEALRKLADTPVVVDERLREEDFGAWENRTRAEALASDPGALAAWEAGDMVAPPGGESLAQVGERVVACADALAARHPGKSVALVSHVGPIKALVCAALELPPSGARRMWLDPASICVVDWRLDEPGRSSGILRLYNAVAHLDPPARWLA